MGLKNDGAPSSKPITPLYAKKHGSSLLEMWGLPKTSTTTATATPTQKAFGPFCLLEEGSWTLLSSCLRASQSAFPSAFVHPSLSSCIPVCLPFYASLPSCLRMFHTAHDWYLPHASTTPANSFASIQPLSAGKDDPLLQSCWLVNIVFRWLWWLVFCLIVQYRSHTAHIPLTHRSLTIPLTILVLSLLERCVSGILLPGGCQQPAPVANRLENTATELDGPGVTLSTCSPCLSICLTLSVQILRWNLQSGRGY